MSTITQPLDALAWYGRNIIAHYHDKISTKRLDLHKITQAPRRRLLAASSDQPICIIGAGVGGLYAAMMLRSVGIPFKIIEASDRAGGRLFTYYFDESVPYDYYVMSFTSPVRMCSHISRRRMWVQCASP